MARYRIAQLLEFAAVLSAQTGRPASDGPRSWGSARMISLSRSCSTSAPRLLARALVITGGVILASCSSIGDHLPTAAGGLPAGAPPRPTTSGSYPAVHDMPPPREQTVLTDEEQKKLEDDLIAARNRAKGAARAK